jgi:hypothetical protein
MKTRARYEDSVPRVVGRIEPFNSPTRNGMDHHCEWCLADEYACFEKHRMYSSDAVFEHDLSEWAKTGRVTSRGRYVSGPTSTEAKDGNPKDGIGVQKLPLSLVPPITVAYGSLAHLNGALKYGKWNWRKTGVRASVYIDALKRHISKWESGEELDEDGVPHLSSIIADTGIILDSRACGKLQDDRPPRVDTTGLFDRLTPIVKALLERHKDKAPRHYTIDDSEQSS